MTFYMLLCSDWPAAFHVALFQGGRCAPALAPRLLNNQQAIAGRGSAKEHRRTQGAARERRQHCPSPATNNSAALKEMQTSSRARYTAGTRVQYKTGRGECCPAQSQCQRGLHLRFVRGAAAGGGAAPRHACQPRRSRPPPARRHNSLGAFVSPFCCAAAASGRAKQDGIARRAAAHRKGSERPEHRIAEQSALSG